MFAIFLSALNSVLGFVARGVFVKFLVFSALFYVTSEFSSYLISSGLLPKASSMQNLMNNLPPSLLYFAAPFRLDYAVPVLFSAITARFAIRRIPLIG